MCFPIPRSCLNLSVYSINTKGAMLSPFQVDVSRRPLKKAQSQQVSNENALKKTNVDIKFEDLFDKINEITQNWKHYVNTPLMPAPNNIPQLKRINTIQYTNSYNNPERMWVPKLAKSRVSPERLKGKSLLNSYHSQGRMTERRVVEGPRIEDFVLGRSLGSGRFGEVYQCKHKRSGTVYALKKLMKGSIREIDMVDQMGKELRIHMGLEHQNITRMYTFFEDQYHIFALLEYIHGQQLMSHRNKGEIHASKVIHQVLQAVEYLQSKNIVHRDIKPQNIMLVDGVVKLCDFGWAANCEDGMRKTYCGTMDYLSPEITGKRQYSLEVDLWSVGVLAFEVIAGFAPFAKQTPRFRQDKVTHSLKLNLVFPPSFSDSAKDFISRLLKENPAERMSVQECQRHPFILSNSQQPARSPRLCQII